MYNTIDSVCDDGKLYTNTIDSMYDIQIAAIYDDGKLYDNQLFAVFNKDRQ